MRSVKAFTAICSLSIVTAFAIAQPQADDRAVGLALPPSLRALLIEEMLAIHGASGQILDALVRGDDQRVADNAQAIHDSFILEQRMTEADHEALHAVSQPFLNRDEAFHELSAELAEAARQRNRPRQRELFAQMIAACVDCHAAHATNRFPDLASEVERMPPR